MTGRSAAAPLLVALSLLAAWPAAAQHGQAPSAAEERATLVTIGEAARRDIRQDRLRLHLRMEQTGGDPARVQAEINRRMAVALDRARAEAAPGRLRVETGGYWIHRERDAAGRETGWRAAQGLTLVGADSAAILALGAKLQMDGALAAGLSWELGEDSRRALEDELTAEAIARLRGRAASVAAALGGTVERIVRLTVGDTGGERPPVMLRAMAAPRAAADAAAIAAEPGTETVHVAIQAEVAIRIRP
jgi:predicted secreted protein